MQPIALSSALVTDAAAISRLESNPRLSEEEKVAEASRQFEAVLLRQILTAARKTVIPSDLEENSAASDMYRDMVNAHLADAISRAGTFGLARSLQVQLQRQTREADTPGPDSVKP